MKITVRVESAKITRHQELLKREYLGQGVVAIMAVRWYI